MSLFAVKLIATPVLIAVATLAARRWGQSIGGWLAGLPLTSGPISVFLVLQQGPVFASKAATATLLGLVGVAAFCLAYHRTMILLPPWGAAAVSVAAYMLVILSISFFPLGIAAAIALVPALLGLALFAIGVPSVKSSYTSSPRWDLPLRMIVATIMVLVITGAAALLGPWWSGLLSPFPVFACVMAVFAHYVSGSASAHRLLRGIVIGSFAFASFFVVVSLALERLSIALTYGLAVLTALGVNGLSLFAIVRGQRGG